MFPALSRPARRMAALIAVLALASVLGMFLHLNETRAESYEATALEMARFFTILTMMLVAVTFALTAIRRQGVPQAWLAALTLSVIMVGAVYHAMLSHLVEFTGVGFAADHGLHTFVPVFCLFWWLFYGPKRRLDYADLPVFVLWPSVYVAYALWRGSVDGVYPYPFMDLATLPPLNIATNLVGLFVSLLLGGVVMVSIGRYADR